MPSRRAVQLAVISFLWVTLVFQPSPSFAGQFGKRLLQIGACAGAGFAGAKLGEVLAEAEAARQKLTPAQAATRKKAYQIGLALALCGGGAAIAGSTYGKLSQRGQEARQKEVLVALEDALPHTYADPENPALKGTVTAQPTFVQGNEECRIVQDKLGRDEALVKYCRPPGGMWAVKQV